jgi:hypothetical protein
MSTVTISRPPSPQGIGSPAQSRAGLLNLHVDCRLRYALAAGTAHLWVFYVSAGVSIADGFATMRWIALTSTLVALGGIAVAM